MKFVQLIDSKQRKADFALFENLNSALNQFHEDNLAKP